jgi:hypothetical protein
MGPLDLSVAFRVVWCGPSMLDAEPRQKFCEKVRLELGSLVRDDSGWDAKSADPSLKDGLSTDVCGACSERDGL